SPLSITTGIFSHFHPAIHKGGSGMKRVLVSLAMSLAMAGIAIAAPVTLTLGYPSGDSKVDIMKDIVKEFEKRHNNQIKVNVVVVPIANQASAWGSYFDKLQTMIAGGNSPDVVRIAIEGIQTFVARDLALPLDEYMKSDPTALENYGDLAPKLQAPFVIGGKTYGFVWDWNNVVIHINT